MTTMAKAAPHVLRGFPHSYTRTTIDSRYVQCEYCEAVVRVKPAKAVESSATSMEAAQRIEGPARDHARSRVLRAFEVAGPIWRNPDPFGLVGGLTDAELIAETGLDPSTARPRRIELAEQNLIHAQCLACGGAVGLKATTCPECHRGTVQEPVRLVTRKNEGGKSCVVWQIRVER